MFTQEEIQHNDREIESLIEGLRKLEREIYGKKRKAKATRKKIDPLTEETDFRVLVELGLHLPLEE